MPKTWPTTCPIGPRFLRVHVPLRDQLIVQHEFPGADQEVHHGVVGHLLGAERGGVRQDHTVAGGGVQIKVIEAVAERHQALAAPVQAHVREGGLVEAVALHHRDVHVTQRLGQRRAVAAFS